MTEPEAPARSVLTETVGAMALARALEDDEQANAVLRASREQLMRRLRL